MAKARECFCLEGVVFLIDPRSVLRGSYRYNSHTAHSPGFTGCLLICVIFKSWRFALDRGICSVNVSLDMLELCIMRLQNLCGTVEVRLAYPSVRIPLCVS